MAREYVYTGIQSIGTTCTLGDIEENDPGDADTETFPMSAVQDHQDPPAWVTTPRPRCRGDTELTLSSYSV